MKRINYKKKDDDLDNKENDYFYMKELEEWNVFDVMKYNKEELQQIIKDFICKYDKHKLLERVKALKLSNKFIESYKFPLV